MKEPLIYKYLDDDELLRISGSINKIEKATSGEVCISIKEKRNLMERKLTLKELAEKEFIRLEVNKTRDATGILIFILLSERKFYILADKGINEKVETDTWEKIKNEMHRLFSEGEFCRGILYAIEETGRILTEKFPVRPDDTNELPDKVRLS